MKLLSALGIDWKILIAQFVNFAILIWVLQRFAYKPIIKFLETRTKKIESGLKNTELAKKKILEIGEKEKEIIKKAKQEARKIIDSSEEIARKNQDEIMRKAEENVKMLSELAEKKIEQEKAKIISEAKSEIADMVVLATEKIIGEKLNSEKDKDLINQIIK